MRFNILFGGQAGQGPNILSVLLGEALIKRGYYVFMSRDYQSLIRGGHNFNVLTFSDVPVYSNDSKMDLIIALDENTINVHKKNLKENGHIISGEGKGNMYFAGRLFKSLCLDFKILEEQLRELEKRFEENMKDAKEGYEEEEKTICKVLENKKKLFFMNGNKGISEGAIKAGLDIYYAYPMTPATSILHFLAEHKLGVETIQLENEISVIIAALGSAYAGKRAMVGTSGGGFALMTEGISFATIAEIPVVIVNSQRTGPATGVPTYSGQSDLNFVLNAGHGDIVKFTIAPSNASECYEWGGRILNLAWKYQTPAVLLIDKEISESTFNLEINTKIEQENNSLWNQEGEYRRYEITVDGISPLAFPGHGVVVKTTSYEHDQSGLTAEESEEDITAMQEKRLRKFESMKEEVDNMEDAIKIFGKKDSKNILVTFGSSTSPSIEAAENFDLKVVQIIVMEPFPIIQVTEAIGEDATNVICVEQNALGQLASLLSKNGIEANELILKYSSRALQKGEIEDLLKEIL